MTRGPRQPPSVTTWQPSWVTGLPPVGPVGATCRSMATICSTESPSRDAPVKDPVATGDDETSSVGSIDIDRSGSAPAGAAHPPTSVSTAAAPVATRPIRARRRWGDKEAVGFTRP